MHQQLRHISKTVPGDIFIVTAYSVPLWEAFTAPSLNNEIEIVGWIHRGDLFTALRPPELEEFLLGVSSLGHLGAVWRSDFRHLKLMTGDDQL